MQTLGPDGGKRTADVRDQSRLTRTFGTAPWLLRLVWILRKRIELIRADDAEQVRESAKKPLDHLPFNQKRAGWFGLQLLTNTTRPGMPRWNA